MAQDVTTPADTVPGYRILQPIGRGGQAQVFLAERERDGRELALKVLDRSVRQDPVFLERFVREYRLLASIEDEHVVRIFDQGFAGERPYIAMEFCPGGTLAARMHQGLSSRQALQLAAQIAKALATIHAHGIVHRDLKPANILFRADGRMAIGDFGLAKNLSVNSTLTAAGQLVATPRYMSPEQCLGLPVDARSDLYSLGVVFYEMLTGRKLLADARPARLIELHVSGVLPRLPDRLAGYQPVLDRLLAKEPRDRYQSARDLFAAIAT